MSKERVGEELYPSFFDELVSEKKSGSKVKFSTGYEEELRELQRQLDEANNNLKKAKKKGKKGKKYKREIKNLKEKIEFLLRLIPRASGSKKSRDDQDLMGLIIPAAFQAFPKVLDAFLNYSIKKSSEPKLRHAGGVYKLIAP
jgi:seryl-tRNA synthetase